MTNLITRLFDLPKLFVFVFQALHMLSSECDAMTFMFSLVTLVMRSEACIGM